MGWNNLVTTCGGIVGALWQWKGVIEGTSAIRRRCCCFFLIVGSVEGWVLLYCYHTLLLFLSIHYTHRIHGGERLMWELTAHVGIDGLCEDMLALR